MTPEAVVPTFQFITNGAGAVSEAILVNACNDFELTACTITTTTSSADVDGDGVNESIVDCIGIFTAGCFPGGGAPIAGDYYIKITIDGVTYYSENFTMGCNWNYNLTWKNSCNMTELYYDGSFFNRLYFRDLQFQRPSYESVREVKENGFGQEVVISSKLYKRYAFQMSVPDWAMDGIFAIQEHDIVSIQKFGEAAVFLTDVQVEVEGSPNDCEHIITISYKVADELLSKTACCGSVYENEDYESDCPDFPGGDPGSGDESCTDYDVQITVDLVSGLLSFNESDIPSDCDSQSIVWTYTPINGTSQVLGAGTGVSLGGYGDYKVSVTRCGCVATDSFSYTDPCGSFDLNVSVNGNIINAGVTGTPESCSITYSIKTESGLEVSTDPYYVATVSGNYVVEATCGDCFATQMVYVGVGSDGTCSHTVTIQRNESILSAFATGCSRVLTWTWELDTGNGFIVVGTNSDLTISENGAYRVTAFCDACPVSEQIVILDVERDCLPIEICNWPDQFNVFITNECLPAECDPPCSQFNAGSPNSVSVC